MIEDNINALEKTWGKPEFFLKADRLAELETLTGLSMKDVIFIRMFKHLRTTDTISISRLGEEIPIPKFWSAFMLVTPQGWDLSTTLPLFNFQGRPVVEYAELNRIIQLSSTCEPVENEDFFPANDTQYEQGGNSQYSLDIYPSLNGFQYMTNIPAGINAETAWCRETGKPFVDVAFLDSGIKWDHEDYQANGESIVHFRFDHITDAEIPSGNGDPIGHGTKAAGIAGAVRNNNLGIAGIAGGDMTEGSRGISLSAHNIWDQFDFWVELPLDNPSTDLEYVAEAIVEASTGIFNHPDITMPGPSHIINYSWGLSDAAPFGWSPFYTDNNVHRIISDAIHLATRNNVINVTARGNNGIPIDELTYPSCYDDNWVLSVGGTGDNGAYCYNANSSGDNFVPNTHFLDVAAPASDRLIRTTNNFGGYSSFGRTSAAAPHVSGTAALLLSYFNDPFSTNSNLAPEDVEFLLQASATDAFVPELDETDFDTYGPTYNITGPDQYIGHGRINAGEALSFLDPENFQLHHYEVPAVFYNLTAYSNVTLDAPLGYANHNGLNIFANDANGFPILYTVKATEWRADFIHSANLPIADIAGSDGIWERHSSSNLFPEIDPNNLLLPHERISLDSDLRGWTYELIHPDGTSYWIPFDPSNDNNPELQFAYTVLEALPVGIDNPSTEHFLTLFPNPTTGIFRIEHSGIHLTQVKISDQYGRQVLLLSDFKGMEGLNIDFLSSGLYFIQAEIDGEWIKSHIVKL